MHSNNKIHIKLGLKTYQIDSPDAEFAAVMNQHFEQMRGTDAQVGVLELLQDYLQLAYELRSARREVARLRSEQMQIIEKLNEIEVSEK